MTPIKIIAICALAIVIMIFFAPNKLSKSKSLDECLGFKLKMVCFGMANDIETSTFQRKIDFWKTSNKFCGTAGMAVPAMATKCCEGFSEMWNTCAEDDCNKCKHSFAAPGGLGICSDCGNGVCDRNNNENYCNCSKDCEPLN